jgi:cardiolipin synthase
VPGVSFRKRIAQAVKRGVRVRIITGAKSDVKISKYARQYLYNWMLGNGVEIYEYQKSVVHAKIAVVDKQWATIGSYDLNNLSLSGNIEMNLDILNGDFATEFQNRLLKIIEQDCILITHSAIIKSNSFIKKPVMWASYQMVRLFFWFNEMMVSTKRK